MAKKKRALSLDEPILHQDHKLVTRRDFLRHGFLTGAAAVTSGSVFSLFSNPRDVRAAVSSDLDALASSIGCDLGGASGNVPFICFDLAGGAGISSNVYVGQQNGQLDPLSPNGYERMGILRDENPGTDPVGTVDTSLGLAFNTDSGFLRGINARFTAPRTATNINGTVIPARSDNDTGNNPHNPLYGIARAGAAGEAVTLIGSRPSESGGNSMSPGTLINPEIRPSKVDRPSDVTGMVSVGNLTGILDRDDVIAVMEAMARISHKKLHRPDVTTTLTNDAVIKELVSCGYLSTADITQKFAGRQVNPAEDTDIVGANGIFSATEFNANNRAGSEYRKTASVMKMVLSGYAGAGCITMGGYDYHTGERGTGETRDELAGECIGACLQYANALNTPVMIYVFSDGSVSSNGRLDTTTAGRGKPEWTGDNSSTACSFFLVYDPRAGRSVIPYSGNLAALELHQQLGWFDAGGSVVRSSSSAADNVVTLAHTVILNYMALNNSLGVNFSNFTSLFPGHGISNLNGMTAWELA